MPANTTHPYVYQPENPDISVWRYMSFSKFVSLIFTKTIFLCRVSLFNDPFEGAVSKATVEFRNQNYKQIPSEMVSQLSAIYQNLTHQVYANCWHMNEEESDAMWKNYGSIDGAIAIQSSYKDLAASIITSSDNECYIGKITYYPETKPVPDGNILTRFMYKKIAFEHEKEIRLIAHPTYASPQLIDGIMFPISLETLIHHRYVSPLSPPWFLEIVEDVVLKYGIHKPISKSSLGSQPIY